MLAAYFDESGTHGAESMAVAVGGFIATADRWIEFDREWRAALKDYGLACFHTRDFVSNDRKYQWGPNRGPRMNRLMTIIKRHVQKGFAVSLDTDAFRQHVVSRKERRYFGNSTYNFCAATIMREVATWAQGQGIDIGISYTYERGARGWREFQTTYDKMCAHPPARAFYRLIGNLELKDKAASTPLQAADFVAYTVHKGRPVLRGLKPVAPRKIPGFEGALDLPILYRHYDSGFFERVKSGQKFSDVPQYPE